MGRHNGTERSPRTQTTKRGESLTESRYEELLKSASSFFASAEGHSEDERCSMIQEIKALMDEHGLTVDDLL